MWTKNIGNAKVKVVDKGYITDEHRNAITLSAMERQFSQLQYCNDGQNKHLRC